jgi:hypothetical protein
VPHGDAHHQGGDGVRMLSLPSNSTMSSLNLTAPTSPGCDGCEAPILPDTDDRPVPCNATLSDVPDLTQAQASSSDGPGYHSKETGVILMVVLLVAGAAVALSVFYCIGKACWKLKTRKAEEKRVTSA